MDHDQLLKRIQNRDMTAYHQLTEEYGWKLYSHLKTRFRDKETLDAAFNETLRQFYNTVAGSEDAVEALLFSYADRTCEHMMQGKNPDMAPAKKQKGKAGTIFFTIAFSILVLGIFVALWVILGLLMDLGIMPEVDLGYSWFNAHLFPWF